MFKKIAVLSLGLAALAGAQAATVTIDLFDVDQALISDTTVNGSAVTSGSASLANGVTRSYTSNLLASAGPVGNTVQVFGGVFDVTNGTGEDSEVVVSYALPALLLPANATNPNFSLLVVESDGNPTNIRITFGGTTLLNASIPGNTDNKLLNFTATTAALEQGGTLQMFINGDSGWDLSLDSFGFTYGVNAVPEPASLALVGLGLAGIGYGRRKARKA